MGYTSERTTINKSLESLNQETQRIQKQTNYEFDRLNQRRRDNQQANMNWMANNQRKLDMGMEQFQQVQDAYEPDTGYSTKDQETMSGMRDEYYNLLQNKVPVMVEGKDGKMEIKKDKDGKNVYEENIKAANEQRNKLEKGVSDASMANGFFQGLQSSANEAKTHDENTPGSINMLDTDSDTLALVGEGTLKESRWDSAAGQYVYDIKYPIMGEDGKPVLGNDGKYTYKEEPDKTWNAGEFSRAVESGAVGIVTQGDGAAPRDALQTEVWDQYKGDFSKFKNMTNLNDQTTHKDFEETLQRFGTHLKNMDVTTLIDNNQNMRGEWTDIVTNIASAANQDPSVGGSLWGGTNPFADMLIKSGVKDVDGNGLIDDTEFAAADANAILGAWNKNDQSQKDLATAYYRNYNPASGVLPSFVNDMIKTSQVIGGDQLTANQRRIQDKDNKRISNPTTPPPANANANANANDNKPTPPPKPAPAISVQGDDGKPVDFDFTKAKVDIGNGAEGTMVRSSNDPNFVAVKNEDGEVEYLINLGIQTQDDKKKTRKVGGKEIEVYGKDKFEEVTGKNISAEESKKKSEVIKEEETEEVIEEPAKEEAVIEEEGDDPVDSAVSPDTEESEDMLATDENDFYTVNSDIERPSYTNKKGELVNFEDDSEEFLIDIETTYGGYNNNGGTAGLPSYGDKDDTRVYDHLNSTKVLPGKSGTYFDGTDKKGLKADIGEDVYKGLSDAEKSILRMEHLNVGWNPKVLMLQTAGIIDLDNRGKYHKPQNQKNPEDWDVNKLYEENKDKIVGLLKGKEGIMLKNLEAIYKGTDNDKQGNTVEENKLRKKGFQEQYTKRITDIKDHYKI